MQYVYIGQKKFSLVVDALTATSTAETITIPSTAQRGNLAVLIDMAFTSSAVPTQVVPSGWSQITVPNNTYNVAGHGSRLTVSRKILEQGDAGTSITGQNGGNTNNKCMFVFRGNGLIASATPSTWNGTSETGNPSSQTASASGGNAPLVVIGLVGEYDGSTANGTPTFSTESPSFDATQIVNSSRLVAGYKIYNSSPADHTIDMGDTGFPNVMASGWIEILG